MAIFQSLEEIKKHHENKNEKKPDWRGGFITNGEIEIPNRYVEGILNNDQNLVSTYPSSAKGYSVLVFKN